MGRIFETEKWNQIYRFLSELQSSLLLHHSLSSRFWPFGSRRIKMLTLECTLGNFSPFAVQQASVSGCIGCLVALGAWLHWVVALGGCIGWLHWVVAFGGCIGWLLGCIGCLVASGCVGGFSLSIKPTDWTTTQERSC